MKVAVVVLVAAAALLAAGAGEIAPGGMSPRIAFVHGEEIWTMAADGSDRRRVARGQSVDWSPDGSLLAYHREVDDEKSAVFVSAPDGTGERLVAGDASEPAWSPDGRRIAFTRFDITDEGFVSEIGVVAPDGSGRRTVLRQESQSLAAVYDPEWTPDGERLAYTRTRFVEDGRYGFDIHSVRADGRDDRVLLRDAKGPVFSADGERIAFGDLRGAEGDTCGSDECYPDADLAVAAADGSGRKVLLRTGVDEGDPAWSRDGSRLAFSSGRNTVRLRFAENEVYTVAPDGSCLTWLTNGSPESGAPAWSADAGPAAPGECGMRSREPVVDARPVRGTRGGLWLGPRFGDSLFASSQDSGDATIFEYTDCALYEPSDCPPAFLLVQNGACERSARRSFRPFALRRARRLGRVVLLRHGNFPSVLAGRHQVGIERQSPASPTQANRLYETIARGIRRVDGRRLDRVRMPARARRYLPKRVRVTTRPC